MEGFNNGIGYKVGHENKVSFWHDIWCAVVPLSRAFPEIYDMVLLKNGSVEDYIVRDAQSHAWELHLRWGVNDWEMLVLLFAFETR